jgi:hypothetical protein
MSIENEQPTDKSSRQPSRGSAGRWWARWKWIVLAAGAAVVCVLACPWLHDLLANWFMNYPVATGLALLLAGLVAGQLSTRAARQGRDKWAQQVRDVTVIGLVLVFVLGVGIIFVGAAPRLAAQAMAAGAFKALALWALAFFAAGFLGGFLFGIPKALQDGIPPQGGTPASAPAARRGLQVNTNLEQISDWLTKIIVGVGLVELKTIPGHLSSLARWVAESISDGAGPSAASVSFAGSVTVFFSVVGFLAGYLITRLFLTGAFDRADPREYIENVATFANDSLGPRILNYWRPGGAADPAAEKKLKEWMTANGIAPPLISALISAAELQEARKKVVAELQIK